MVIWSEPAKADLKSIHDFISRSSPYYAKKVAQDVIDRTEALNEMPFLGKVVSELNDEQVREISLYSYRILYEVSDRNVFILAVIHYRRDLQPDMIER